MKLKSMTLYYHLMAVMMDYNVIGLLLIKAHLFLMIKVMLLLKLAMIRPIMGANIADSGFLLMNKVKDISKLDRVLIFKKKNKKNSRNLII